MKPHIHLIISIAMGIALLILIIRHNRQSNQIAGLESGLSARADSIEYLESMSGKIIAQKEAAELSAQDMAKVFPEFADRLTREMDIKLKNLKSAITAEFVARGSGSAVVNQYYVTDSTGSAIRSRPVWKLQVQDGYLDFTADILDSLNAPYTYHYHDTLTYAFHLKRKWILGNAKLYGSGMLGNPNAKIVNSTSVEVRDYRDKRFGVGPFVGLDYQGRITVGLGVQYGLFRF